MESEFRIADPNFWKEIEQAFGKQGGVYRLFSKQNGAIRSINRFMGTDETGTLYIGKANSFLNRVIDLKKSILSEYRGKSHICGRRYKALCLISSIAEKFPEDTLYVQLFSAEFPHILESRMLEAYERKFGEVPPMNAVSNKAEQQADDFQAFPNHQIHQ